MADIERLSLLIKEVKDEYVQENFLKLKRYLVCLEETIGSGGVTNTTNNINNINNSPWDAVLSVDLPPSVTTTLHSVAIDSTVCGEYKVCLKEQGGTTTKNFNVKYRKTDVDVKDQIYAKSGDAMNISVFVVRTPTTMELQITNNELYIIDADFTVINT